MEAKQHKAVAYFKAAYKEKPSSMKAQKDEQQTVYEELINTSDEKWKEVKNDFLLRQINLRRTFNHLILKKKFKRDSVG